MNRRVLVVDDSPDLLAGTRFFLRERFEVHTALGGSDALELCRTKGPYAVVVTDQDMPGMSGIEFLAQLRKDWPDTVRIMLTGYAELDVAVRALHEGAIFRFLAKPVPPVELCAAVEAAVERVGELEQERLVTEQLQLSRESLLSLTETLEKRMTDQLVRLGGLQQFASDLRDARSLRVIAGALAHAASKLTGGRAATARLEAPRTEGGIVEHAGPSPGAKIHTEPVVTDGRMLGHLEVDAWSRTLGPLNESDRRSLASLAATAAIAAHKVIHRAERDEAQHATIFALARLAEYRDDETGRHLERVSEYCRVLAHGLREDGHETSVITDSYVEDLVLSAPLHDIGKVGIPDAILHKPGPLDEAEWVIMRKHPTIGAETLRNVLESSGEQSFLRMAHEIAWCHHEKWDGSGYPRGLRQEEIPLAARIMALADCYDALTSRRPYKEEWTHAAARAWIVEQSGQHFDARLVSVFEKRADAFDEVRRRLADDERSIAAHAERASRVA
jgi:response regulator RpfG family c-di-GMP phosphodiesterase